MGVGIAVFFILSLGAIEIRSSALKNSLIIIRELLTIGIFKFCANNDDAFTYKKEKELEISLSQPLSRGFYAF